MANNNYAENVSFGLPTDEIANARYQFDAFIREMYAALPVKVVAVNSGGLAPAGTVDIVPLVKQQTAGGEQKDYATIHNAPYFRLQGGTNAIIIDPRVGDIGVAVFSSRDISGVKRVRGASQTPSLRKFSLSDAVYIGGILNAIPAQYIHFEDSGITVYSPSKINLKAPEVVIDTTNFTVNASTTTVNAPSNQVNGEMTVTGGMTGGSGMTMTGDITADGISVKNHTHGGVQSGGSNTGVPQ